MKGFKLKRLNNKLIRRRSKIRKIKNSVLVTTIKTKTHTNQASSSIIWTRFRRKIKKGKISREQRRKRELLWKVFIIMLALKDINFEGAIALFSIKMFFL